MGEQYKTDKLRTVAWLENITKLLGLEHKVEEEKKEE